MANAEHYVWLYPPTGAGPILLDNFVRVECVLVEREIGAIEVTLPLAYDDSLFAPDGRIAFYRKPASDVGYVTSQLIGQTTFLVRRLRKRQVAMTRDGGMDWQQVVTAVHPNHLLVRRVIAYDEGTAEASKTATADDLIKAIVRENFTAATDTTRNWTAFTVDADTSASATVRIEMSYRTVLDVAQEVCAQAATEGTYTGFEVSVAETGSARLRTYTGQRGVDRSSAGGKPLIISSRSDSLDAIEMDDDSTSAPSFIYALGQGVGDERAVGTWEDTALTARSPWGRIERATNQSQTETTLMLEGVAKRRLWELRPRKIFSGRVRDTEVATFGQEYDWGDRVIGEFPNPVASGIYLREEFVSRDCRVDPVHITVERAEDPETGASSTVETLDIRLRSDG